MTDLRRITICSNIVNTYLIMLSLKSLDTLAVIIIQYYLYDYARTHEITLSVPCCMFVVLLSMT